MSSRTAGRSTRREAAATHHRHLNQSVRDGLERENEQLRREIEQLREQLAERDRQRAENLKKIAELEHQIATYRKGSAPAASTAIAGVELLQKTKHMAQTPKKRLDFEARCRHTTYALGHNTD